MYKDTVERLQRRGVERVGERQRKEGRAEKWTGGRSL